MVRPAVVPLRRSCKESAQLKGVMTGLMIDTLSELCSPFSKGGNSACITAIANGLFPPAEYWSLN